MEEEGEGKLLVNKNDVDEVRLMMAVSIFVDKPLAKRNKQVDTIVQIINFYENLRNVLIIVIIKIINMSINTMML